MSQKVVDLRNKRPERPAARTVTHTASPTAAGKRQSLRERRRKARLTALAVLCVIVAILAYAIHAASYLPRLRIGTIKVVGTQVMQPQTISAYINALLHDGKNHYIARDGVFTFPAVAIERALTANFPRIKAARIDTAGFSNTAIVTIEERTPYAQWCSGASCYYFDKSGFIYADTASVPTQPETEYVFTGGITGEPLAKNVAASHLPGIIGFLKQLKSSGYQAAGVTIESDQDFTVHFRDSFDLKATYGSNADVLVHDLALVLNSDALRGKTDQIEYIDLRFGNRVYYKLKGVAATLQ